MADHRSTVVPVVPLWIFKNPKILLRKIPRLNKNSQAILKIGEKGENENKLYTFMFTNIEKNILHSDMCQSYWLTESEFESPVIMLTQKVINYTIGLIVLNLQSQIIRCQNYTQNFISFTTAKNPEIAQQNPQIPSWPPNSQAVGARSITDT